MTPMPGTPNDRRRAQEAFGGGETERTRPSNFDGREPRPTVKAMFSTNEGDDALLDEAFDVVEADARAALLGEVREGVNAALDDVDTHTKHVRVDLRDGEDHTPKHLTTTRRRPEVVKGDCRDAVNAYLDTLSDGGPK